jgi:acyl-CoA thioester hydrolase
MPRAEWPLPSYVHGPEPVAREIVVQEVAFRDCDPMGVLWHGHYLAYCEHARHRLGERLAIGVRRLADLHLAAPVVRSQVIHLDAVRPGDALATEVALYACEQPRLYHRYRMSVAGRPVAEAETEQVLTRADLTLILQLPEAFAVLRGG